MSERPSELSSAAVRTGSPLATQATDDEGSSSGDDLEFWDSVEVDEETIGILTRNIRAKFYARVFAAPPISTSLASGAAPPNTERLDSPSATAAAPQPPPSAPPVGGHRQTFNFHNGCHGCGGNNNYDTAPWWAIALMSLILLSLGCQFHAWVQQLVADVKERLGELLTSHEDDTMSVEPEEDADHTFSSFIPFSMHVDDLYSYGLLSTLATIVLTAGPTLVRGYYGVLPSWPFKI